MEFVTWGEMEQALMVDEIESYANIYPAAYAECYNIWTGKTTNTIKTIIAGIDAMTLATVCSDGSTRDGSG
jgi:hypothetical protein